MKKRKKRKNKNRQLTVCLATFFLIIVAGAVILGHFKPDWVYLARQSMNAVFSSAELTAFSPETGSIKTASADELLSGKYNCIPGEELLLVNEKHPLPSDYEPELETYPDTDIQMASFLTEPYRRLAEDVSSRFQKTLYIRSSFRTAEEQAQEKEAQPVVAASSGASEHETGMALDVYVPYYAGYGFLKSEAGQYVNSNCWKYGFIIRYPFLKTGSTGIPFEPWHLRYVGLPHAEIMAKNSWTLEEYLDQLVPGTFYRNGPYWIARQKGHTLSFPDTSSEFHISPDNQGFYVLWGIMNQSSRRE